MQPENITCKPPAKWVGFWLKIALTVTVILILFYTIDYQAVWTEIKSASPGFLAAAGGVFALQLLLLAARLHLIASILGSPINVATASRATMLGLTASQVLPSIIGGDAMRIITIRRAGVALNNALRQIALDRIIGLLSLLVAIALAVPFVLGRLPNDLPVWQVLFVFFALAAAIVLGITAISLVSRRPDRLRRGILSRPLHFLEQIWVSITALVASRPRALMALFLAYLGCTAYSATFWLVARSLSLKLDLPYVFFIVPVAVIIMMIPVTISGWGIREAVLATALGFVGIPAAQSVAASVLFGIIPLPFSLFGLLFFFKLPEGQKKEQLDQPISERCN